MRPPQCQVLLFGLECFSTDFPSSYLIAVMEQGLEKSLWNVHRHVKSSAGLHRLANVGHQNEGLRQVDLGQMENMLPGRNFWTALLRVDIERNHGVYWLKQRLVGRRLKSMHSCWSLVPDWTCQPWR